MNKKAQETAGPENIMDIIRVILTALVVLFLIYVGVQLWYVSNSKDQEVVNSFTTLAQQVDSTIATGTSGIVPFYITDKYDLVAFDNKQLSSGRYQKPSECGLSYCLVICKQGVISLKNNCMAPLTYKQYNVPLTFDVNNPVLVHGINGIINVNVTKISGNIVITTFTSQNS